MDRAPGLEDTAGDKLWYGGICRILSKAQTENKAQTDKVQTEIERIVAELQDEKHLNAPEIPVYMFPAA